MERLFWVLNRGYPGCCAVRLRGRFDVRAGGGDARGGPEECISL